MGFSDNAHQLDSGGEIVTLGIDLAKNLFALHGVGTDGKVALLRPAVKRAKLLELTANLPPCLIGKEACSGAHHWAREMTRQGHVVPHRTQVRRALPHVRQARQE